MNNLTEKEKALLLYGYTFRLAQEAKEDGLFKDLTIKEIIDLYLNNFYFKEGDLIDEIS